MVDCQILLADGSKGVINIPSYAISNTVSAKALLQLYITNPDNFVTGAEGGLMPKVHELLILIREG
jgi:hypothetical protein